MVSPSSARAAAPTRRTTSCRRWRARLATPTTSTSAPRPATPRRWRAWRPSFGSGAMTNSIGEIKDVDDAVHHRLQPHRGAPHHRPGDEEGAAGAGRKLIVCDPRQTWVAEHADIHIQHTPGTDNMLINAMMQHILDQGLHDHEFIETRCENFEAFRANLDGCSVEEAAEVCGVEADLIRRAAEMYAQGEPSGHLLHAGHHRAHLRHRERAEPRQPGHALRPDRQAPPAASTRCADRTTCRAAATWARCHTSSPATSRSSTTDVREKFEQGLERGDAHQQGWPHALTSSRPRTKAPCKALYVFGEDPATSRAQPGQGHRQPREAGLPGRSRRSS